ncbi:MAG: rhomboid family intramembrane serine protease [Deltaproteobacteria bacterium]|nr:rhomboid family intramembrane serine protease [Deltaproteobacteria bacterium]
MLVVPIIGKIGWRNPPVVTLSLIVVNVAVFLLSLSLGLSEVIKDYGFIPAAHEPVTFLTHMFLHGDFSHIIGNMIFLWLVGSMLEMAGGRVFLLICYFLTGLGAVGLFWAIYGSSDVPLVGASGAIAGLMGAVTVMFGRTKIKVFYSLGFYFDYVRIPAIALLPLWIGNELFQLAMTPESRIAYVAHLGGLISGGLIAFAGRAVLKNRAYDVAEEPQDEITPLVEAALMHLEKLELAEGRELLVQALEKSPQDEAILLRIFNIDQHEPDSPRFHATAQQLFSLLSADPAKQNLLYQTYCQYARLSPEPRLSPNLHGKICSAFIALGQIETAEEILERLIEKSPQLHFLPSLSYDLARSCKAKRMEDKALRWHRLICDAFPGSQEAALVREQKRDGSIQCE